MSKDVEALFQARLGLSEAKAKETAKNSALSANLMTVLKASPEDTQGKGSLLYTAASKVSQDVPTVPQSILQHIVFLIFRGFFSCTFM